MKLAFAMAMVTRAEYLDRSLSRRQPWLAYGISRRTWERRRRKSIAADATQAENSKPHEVSTSTAQSSAVNSAKDMLRRPAGKKMTRAEYLDRSLSRLQPWLNGGISRRTWERRQSKGKIAISTRARRAIAPTGEAREEAKHVASAAEAQTTAIHGDKKLLHRQDRELLMIRVHHYWMRKVYENPTHGSVSRAILAIELPERFRHLDVKALVKLYRRGGNDSAVLRSLDRVDRKMGYNI